MTFKQGDQVTIRSGYTYLGTGTITRFRDKNGVKVAKVEMDDGSMSFYHPLEHLSKR